MKDARVKTEQNESKWVQHIPNNQIMMVEREKHEELSKTNTNFRRLLNAKTLVAEKISRISSVP